MSTHVSLPIYVAVLQYGATPQLLDQLINAKKWDMLKFCIKYTTPRVFYHLLMSDAPMLLIDAAWNVLKPRKKKILPTILERYLLLMIDNKREDRIKEFTEGVFIINPAAVGKKYIVTWNDAQYQNDIRSCGYNPIHVILRILETEQYGLLKYFVRTCSAIYLSYAVLVCYSMERPCTAEIRTAIEKECDRVLHNGELSDLLRGWVMADYFSHTQLIDIPVTVSSARHWIKHTDMFDGGSKEYFDNCIVTAKTHVINSDELCVAIRKMFMQFRKKAPTNAQIRAKRNADAKAKEEMRNSDLKYSS